MTLNASGPISLGGATAGQSINLELSQAATATTSLNATNVRALAGVPSGQIIMPTNFWGKSSFTPRALYTTSDGASFPGAVQTLSGPQVQITGTPSYTTTSVSSTQLYYMDSDGIVQWSRALPTAPEIVSIGAIISDDGGVYWAASDPTTPRKMIVFRYNSSGVLQWQNYYTHAAATGLAQSRNIVSDASSNLYVAYSASSNAVTVIKISPSGSVLYSTQYVLTSFPSGISISMNPARTKLLFEGGQFPAAPATRNLIIMTTDLNGNLLTSFRLDIPSGGTVWNGSGIDNSDNIYCGICGVQDAVTRVAPAEMVKTTATGTILWRTSVTPTNFASGLNKTITSPDGQFVYYSYNFQYVQYDGAILSTAVLIKLNTSSGAIIWMRQNQGPVISLRTSSFQNIAVDNSGNIKYGAASFVYPTGGTQYTYPRYRAASSSYSYTDAQLASASKTYTINGYSVGLVANTFGSGALNATTSAFTPSVSANSVTVTASSIAITSGTFAWAVAL